MTAPAEKSPSAWTLFWRFWVRAFCDDDGSPSIWPFLAIYVAYWYTDFIARAEPAFEAQWLATAIVALILIITASMKLGASIIVPVAEAFMAALGKLVSAGSRVAGAGASVARSVTTRLSAAKQTDYEPPDRNTALADSELARPGKRPDPSAYRDDERDE